MHQMCTRMRSWRYSSWRAQVSARSRQLLQQRLRILQVSRIKALGEPVVDWCQEVMGFLAFALLLPESSETGCGTEFPGFGLLVLGDTDGLMETGFCFSLIV